MSLRVRKLIGLVGILGFILAYMRLMILVAAHVPDHGPWQFAFYALAGVSWGLPILPLISWMNRGR